MNTRTAPHGFTLTSDGTIARTRTPVIRGAVGERRSTRRFPVDDILYRAIRNGKVAS